jgi:hypothetical protein
MLASGVAAFVLMVLLLFATQDAFGAVTTKLVGKNCTLGAPPASAGEIALHAQIMLVYPRSEVLAKTYTGCQSTFISFEGGPWRVVGRLRFSNGVPVQYRHLFDEPRYHFSCAYGAGKLTRGDLRKCPEFKLLVPRTLPPGCHEKMGTEAYETDCKDK